MRGRARIFRLKELVTFCPPREFLVLRIGHFLSLQRSVRVSVEFYLARGSALTIYILVISKFEGGYANFV